MFVALRYQSSPLAGRGIWLAACRQFTTTTAASDGESPLPPPQKPTHFAVPGGWRYMPSHEGKVIDHNEPLAVVIGWLGCPPKYLHKYLEWYHSKGIDTLSLVPIAKDVLLPDSGRARMMALLEHLDANTTTSNRPWLIHMFSTGGYMYGQMMDVMKKNPQRFEKITSNIRLQVVDSPVDFQHIACRLPRAVFPHSRARQVVSEALVTAWLNLFKKNTSKLVNSSRNFHNNCIKAPALWYFSHDDDIGPPEDCIGVINEWRALGIKCHVMAWPQSRHVTHMRHHSHDYTSSLDRCLSAYVYKTIPAFDDEVLPSGSAQ